MVRPAGKCGGTQGTLHRGANSIAAAATRLFRNQSSHALVEELRAETGRRVVGSPSSLDIVTGAYGSAPMMWS